MREQTLGILFSNIYMNLWENVYFYILDRSAKGEDRNAASGHGNG